MAIIALKAWYLREYEPIRQVIQRPPDLRLSRNSLLKSGLRADFLNDKQAVQDAEWFQRYLEGETIEFYVEGSGGYAISNIDLISQEVYFTKQELTASLEPIIYYSYQTEYSRSSEGIREALDKVLEGFNQRSRLPLSLEVTPHPTEGALRLSSSQLRKISKSLVFVADSTAITQLGGSETRLVASSTVCVEVGYAIHSKKASQILLLRQERTDVEGEFPFDFPNHQQLSFRTLKELQKSLPTMVESLLGKYQLLSR